MKIPRHSERLKDVTIYAARLDKVKLKFCRKNVRSIILKLTVYFLFITSKELSRNFLII